MEEGLFAKYSRVIQKQKSEKEVLIKLIVEKTGVTFEEHELVIQKKILTLHTSSSKRSVILQKNIQAFLKESGYILK